MNLLCALFQNFWNNIYSTYFKNLDPVLKSKIGYGLAFGSLIVFVLCTKNSKKGDMVGNWFLFWMSIMMFIGGILYLNY